MVRLSANISMLFQELEFWDRFEAAAAAGFGAIEMLFPYAYAPDKIAQALKAHNLQVSVFNLSPGDWSAGMRGLAVDPAHRDAFRKSVVQGLEYAEALQAPHVHVMAGIAAPDEQNRKCYIENIIYAADRFSAAGRRVLIEPINARSMLGYFLNSTDQALQLLADINHPAVGLQFDIFHHQMSRGDVFNSLQAAFPKIRHIQIAGVPERHEPNFGELNIHAVLDHLDALGYKGWVGCEYRPRTTTQEGLHWMQRYIELNTGQAD